MTSPLRYETVYGPAREYRAGASRAVNGRKAEGASVAFEPDPRRC
jgi:hypothetical protein